MCTKTNKIGAPAWALSRANIKFSAVLRGRELPPNCLEIGGRPWWMSASYEHVTDRRERRTKTYALTHINTPTHTRTHKTRERERDRKIGREREREREREGEREEWIEKGQPGITTIQGIGNMQ